MDAQVVGERIAKLRKSHNMTQKQLSDKLSVTYKAVSKWETGAGLPDIAVLPALASVFNVSVDEILSDSSNDDNKEVNHSNTYDRILTVKRYIRKPITIIASSFIIVLIALAVIFNNLKTNDNFREGLIYDEGTFILLGEESGFGVTGDHARTIYDRQLAEDIKAHLLHSDYLEDALVLVSTAGDSPFRIQENEATISIILTITESYSPSDVDLQAIENLIRGFMKDIKDENISITDSKFNYYPISNQH